VAHETVHKRVGIRGAQEVLQFLARARAQHPQIAALGIAIILNQRVHVRSQSVGVAIEIKTLQLRDGPLES
jgi:hypothetical protein